MGSSHLFDEPTEDFSDALRILVDDTEKNHPVEDPSGEIPDWKTLKEIGAGDGPKNGAVGEGLRQCRLCAGRQGTYLNVNTPYRYCSTSRRLLR